MGRGHRASPDGFGGGAGRRGRGTEGRREGRREGRKKAGCGDVRGLSVRKRDL